MFSNIYIILPLEQTWEHRAGSPVTAPREDGGKAPGQQTTLAASLTYCPRTASPATAGESTG